MRNTFARVMTELAEERSDVCLLSGDIGNRMFDQFKSVAPNRFLNCGIAEANMMSMATGMGMAGLIPVVYTITPFTTTRCLEQIRTGVAYHESPVIIVGTGSGLSYAELGSTHHSLEDIAITRCIPNLQVCAPADSIELEAQLRQAVKEKKPTYIRIGKKGEPDLHSENKNLGIGKANMLATGKKILIIGVGPILTEALKARRKLIEENIEVAVASMGSVKPLDEGFLTSCIKNGYENWISLEEHYKVGGLGSTLLEWLSNQKYDKVSVKRMGIESHFIHQLGNQEYVRTAEGLDSQGIVKMVKSLCDY